MSWAIQNDIDTLKRGTNVVLRPRGNSMLPRIKSGQYCLIAPLKDNEPNKGDVVLCKVKGKVYLHLVKAVQENRYLIGNNKGKINGWTSRDLIYGKLIEVKE